MPRFNYKIKEQSGEITEAFAEAEDKYALVEKLKGEGKTVVSVKETKASTKYFNIEFLNELLARVKLQDKINFSGNLAAMIGAGLSISRALAILERQTSNIKFKKVIRALSADINQGGSLSNGLSKFPKIFSPLFVSMVSAGEESGGLSDSLKIISGQLEKSYILRKKIRGAMIYPAIVLVAMIIIGVLMLIYVVPTLTATFEELNAELPTTTKAVVFISNALSESIFLIIVLLAAFMGAFFRIKKTKVGKSSIDFLLLHTPVISKIVKESNSAYTTRTLSSLISSGVDMIEALSITGDVLQNSYYKEVLNKAMKDVQKGAPLSGVFKEREDIYPILVGEMIEVGEETGKLSEMLMNVADFYEGEVDSATKNLSTIVEPVLMVAIGAAVGFFAVSMISPMYDVMNNI